MLWYYRALSYRADGTTHVAVRTRCSDARLREVNELVPRAERLAAIGKLAAHVNHEIRNPLNSIRLNTDLLEEDLAGAPKESRDMLASVQREVERLTAITEQYLWLARVHAPSLKRGRVDELIDALLAFLGPVMEAQACTWK